MTNRSKPNHATGLMAPNPPRAVAASRGAIPGICAAVLLSAIAGTSPSLAASPKRTRSLEEQVRAQQRMLEQQAEELKELRREIRQQRAVGAATEATATEASQTAAQVKSDLTAAKQKLPGDWAKSLTVFGDVRFRHEGFYNQPQTEGQTVTARNRDRVRGRLGVKYTFSDELSASIRGATGAISDPVSTNETLTGNFSRKNFNLDHAFFTFAPGKSFGLRPGIASITVGKFPNPNFKNSELIFDEDISAEGLSQTFQLLEKPAGWLDQVKLHLSEWSLNEVSNKSDGWMFGGQVNPTFHSGPVQFEAGIGQLWWLNSDLIAQAISRNTTGYTTAGAPVANGNFNSVLQASNQNLLTIATIQPPTLKGGKRPAAFQAITGYKSGFNQTTAAVSATMPNVVQAQPLKVWLDYVYNWEAANVDAHGVQAGVRLGQTKVRGDWSVFGFYERLGQEAVISAFTSSEFGPNGGSNLSGYGVGLEYQLLNPLTLSAKGYFSNFINRPVGVVNNPTLNRIQLDALLKF